MTNPTEQLHGLLQIEQLDTLLFRGSTPKANRLVRVFGGQVLAQSLNAAVRTIPEDRQMHSMHAYFLRPGDVNHPIIYEVDPVRDGGSFSTRRVVATQHGKAIFITSVSFKTPEAGLEHSDEMPDVPPPGELPSDIERYKKLEADNPEIGLPNKGDAYQCFDIRTVGELPFLIAKGNQSSQGFWFKPKHRLEADFGMHQAFLAYVSDLRLIVSAILPHGYNEVRDTLQTASLDHSLWVHRKFDINDWHYQHMAGPVSAGGCGLNFGQFYNSKGKLVASTSQEGLMRVKKKAVIN